MDINLYKPFGVNFHTLFFFVIPLVIGIKRHYYDVSRGCLLVIISESGYHATYCKEFEILNTIVVSCCLLYYMILGYTYTLYYLTSLVSAMSSILIYKYLSKSRYGIIAYSTFHLLCSFGISTLIIGCDKLNECLILKKINYL